MTVDKAAVWPASVLTALTGFKEQEFFPFSSFCSEVDLFLQCPSPCLVFPSRFPLIPVAASVQITAPRHVYRPERASCCLLYLWNSQKQAGRTEALNIYISPERFKGSSGRDKPRQTFPHWKIYDLFTLRNVITAHFYFPKLKRSRSYHNMLFT